jgi:protein SCO1/2
MRAMKMALLFMVMLVAHEAVAATQYPVSGMIVSVDRATLTFTASIQAIPNYMRAMTMPFGVKAVKDLDGLVPGAIVEFTLVVDQQSSYAERLKIVRYANIEQDPFSASRLKLLSEIVGGATAATKALAIGEAVPDFTLTDQRGRPLQMADLRGKVVALNFIYTSCALPDFCLRLANNFGVLQKRFKARLGRDLMLVTVTFDPTHDGPEVLARYAAQWGADAATWRFLTGPVPEVQRVCHLFGVHAFPNEGLMDHSLHTVVIDRQGKLVANIEGNQFTATQLGDLTAGVLQGGK